MRVLGWRAWYSDGSVFDSLSSAWNDLPKTGVVVVMVYFDEATASGIRYRRILSGVDYYSINDPTAIVETNDCATPDAAEIKLGQLVSDDEFATTSALAFAAMEL